MRIIVSGAAGFMGREVLALCRDGYRGALCVGCVDIRAGDGISPSLADCPATADVLIDFSHHTGTLSLLAEAEKRGLPAVIATTGHTDEEKNGILRFSRNLPVFFSANTSVGVALMARLVRETASLLPQAEIEIIETHHSRKLDAPSGTALMLADSIREARPDLHPHTGRTGHQKRDPAEIGIHSVRIGNVVGRHEVMFSTGSETVTITHEAHSRTLFAQGAIAAAEFLIGKPAGLYTMKDVLGG